MTSNPLLDLHRETVHPDWVDYNGHMNVAYYMLVFDHATDVLLDHIGLDKDYRESSGESVFVLEAHITYDNEVMQGERVAVTTQILDVDAKRMHVFHRMVRDGEDSELIATNELMILYMNMNARRSTPMPEAILNKLKDMQHRATALPHPAQAGSIIGIRRSNKTT